MGCVSVTPAPTAESAGGSLSRAGTKSCIAIRPWSSRRPKAATGSSVRTARAWTESVGKAAAPAAGRSAAAAGATSASAARADRGHAEDGRPPRKARECRVTARQSRAVAKGSSTPRCASHAPKLSGSFLLLPAHTSGTGGGAMPTPSLHLPRCCKTAERLSQFLDDELDERARHEVAIHLAICEACAHLAADLAATVHALHRLHADRDRDADPSLH